MSWFRRFFNKRNAVEPVEIGPRPTAAHRADEQTPSSPPHRKPGLLPEGLHSANLDLDLIDSPEHPLDAEVSALCHRFVGSDEAGRLQVRRSLSEGDFRTLSAFSMRSAVLALRDRNPEHVADGLIAVAMMHPGIRDKLRPLALLYYAGRTIEMDVEGAFRNAVTVAAPAVSTGILNFLERPEKRKEIRNEAGYTVVETEHGPALVQCGFHPYAPAYPLDKITLRLRELIKQGNYKRVWIRLAEQMWPWLSSLAPELVSGAAIIDATARSPASHFQSLHIFLVEVKNEKAATSLLKQAEGKQTRANDLVMIAVKEQRLFCLAMQRSHYAGEQPCETQASLQRFAPAIADILHAHMHE